MQNPSPSKVAEYPNLAEGYSCAAGAAGKLDSTREYGVQDFFGQIDELRIWRTVRSEDQIRQVRFRANLRSAH